MSDENTEAQVAEAAETTAEAPAKAKKEPRVEEALFCTDLANGEGTVHAQIQRYVFDNPGATRSAVVKALAGKIGTKSATANERYVGAYVAGGIRRGYLTTDGAKAAKDFPAKAAKEKSKSEKVAKGDLTKQGRALVETLEAIIAGADGAERTTPISVGTLTEKMGNKPLSHIARTLTKLETDGYITVSKDEGDKVTGVALTEKTVPIASAPAEEAAAA